MTRPDEGGPEEGHVFQRERGARPAAELATAALLLAAAGFAIAFVVVFFALPHDTQLQGAALALALGCLGAALTVASKGVVPREQAIEERPQLAHPEAEQPVEQTLREVGDGVSRRRLLGGAGVAAGTTLAVALAAPLASLGPAVGDSIVETPWRRGVRVVDEKGRPLTAADVPPGSFVTAFPEGGDKRELGSAIVLVHEDVGILAYSKICTHAGCAVALYRSPTYEPTSDPPGLACPCHYSVFDTRHGGRVVAGPAGRPLPRLPLQIGAGGELRAAGGFSAPIGPSWWSVRRS
jgi:ubiquinol-cytochrome c reductase iron-sulfur subunit